MIFKNFLLVYNLYTIKVVNSLFFLAYLQSLQNIFLGGNQFTDLFWQYRSTIFFPQFQHLKKLQNPGWFWEEGIVWLLFSHLSFVTKVNLICTHVAMKFEQM